MLMNGYSVLGVSTGEYDLKAIWPEVNYPPPAYWRYDYIASVFLYGTNQNNYNRFVQWVVMPSGSWPFWIDGFQMGSPDPQLGPPPFSTIGRGIYKIICTWGSNSRDTVWFEQDAGNCYNFDIKLVSNAEDYGGNSGYGLIYHIQKPLFQWGPWRSVKACGHYLKCYDAYPNDSPHVLGQDYRDKAYGNNTYSTNFNNTYTVIPQDARLDCNNPPIPNENHDYTMESDNNENGNLSLNLTIAKNVSTLTDENKWITLCQNGVKQPLLLTILNGSTLTLALNINLNLNAAPSWYPDCVGYNDGVGFLMTDKAGGNLVQSDGSKIILNQNGQYLNTELLLEYGSHYTGNGNSEIRLYPGGMFCNQGAIINGILRLHYMSRTHEYTNCTYPTNPIYQNTQIILDSATLEIPENTSIILDGNSSSIIVGPTSKMSFAQNSKLILQNGAHLIADHATFTSLDPNSTWDGIYLNDISNDTITNCTIENASNGINIKNKCSYTSNQPSTEISNCTFSNTTSNQLTNGIYVSASNNVLIRNNNFSSTQLIDAFANAVLAEYCPSGAFDIVDNNFNKIHNGISIIQSSPYIARNSITGLQSDGDVIYLDNSNGMIKYNNTNYGTHSLNALYSSPYLLKNSFNNASVRGIDIYRNSIPVMHPINSGTTLSWLAGNNLINGNPSSCGIGFQEESYPAMDSGYNKITVNNSDYMNGDISSVLQANLPASYNYWGEVPVQQKFNVTNGIVIDTPTFDGSTLPATNYYDLTDIGFGLFDTVFVENLGDNPGDEILFLQAYDKERANQFSQAITLYKQVIQNYITSTYAPVSLSRIFNCLEKSRGTISDFQMLQAYMNQLRNNTNYPEAVKEIAEDFMIKSKMKQGFINDAISDYQLIYQQNQNNSKGLHALINKECLIAMRPDSNDNPAHRNFANTTEHKLRSLSLILGRNIVPADRVTNGIIPKEYILYQNYPNPFNPVTTIKYDIPKSGEVSIKIYDLLGKEIYSLSEFKVPGSYSLKFDGTNFASGMYFYRIETGSFVSTKKMVLIK
jgi:hypothetical protein